MTLVLKKPLTALKGITDSLAQSFENLGVKTVGDLLYHFPSRYEDRTKRKSIAEALKSFQSDPEIIVSLMATCESKKSFMFKEREILSFSFSDGTGEFSVAAWNPLHRFFKMGEAYLMSGKLKRGKLEYQLNLLDYERLDEEALESWHHGRIVPIYSSTEGLFQKRIRHTVLEAFKLLEMEVWDYSVPSRFLPEGIEEKSKVAFNLHFPKSWESLNSSRQALAYEELFLFQVALAKQKKNEKEGKLPNRYPATQAVMQLRQQWPFTLTTSQDKVLAEIISDLESNAVMGRLLHGEVGSGKTLVALLASLRVVSAGYQVAVMVPTEILARQHLQTFTKWLTPLGIDVGFLAGGSAQSESVLKRLREGELKLVIGTQALMQPYVEFLNLSFVIFDEFHRFGVDQRKKVLEKGSHVDQLLMSATPIPRSLSLSIFGNLDLSTLVGRPAGGEGRKSKLLPENERGHAYRFLIDRIRKGEQGLVIFPAIDSVKKDGLKSLMKEYKSLKQDILKALPTGILHGEVLEETRQKVINDYLEGKIKILFATTVLEVGIDFPNATVMIIESADRFGLSQLHQLRGRVGRGVKAGYVYLISPKDPAPLTQVRLEKFCETDDGFALSELDLEIRGPGDFLGTKQSGNWEFKVADLIKDFDLLKKAKEDATDFIFNPKKA